ncbi:DUF1080 domain-containing protein [Stieleria sp. TO1_6]|uniref:3-keto-disaccharide hydrolase n=1 Tax=Stieleria tagensis TaxID=2956795 RepID=UPI00209AFC78|nr:DUF1080 domain-containing protein [Stieleria tagensis]MCO8121227.1 DUF1080 domain-containing protein [Stieleria tagensis]
MKLKSIVCVAVLCFTNLGWTLPPVQAEPGNQLLFDGKNLDGWQVKPAELSGDWKAEDGLLVAENPDKKGSYLWTKKEYQDYELELDYQTSSDYYDTGVMLRGDGHQVQIGISGSLQKDMTGCIYAPKDKRGSYPAQSDKIATVHKVGQWNHLRIVLTGKRVQTFLNGEPFVDYTGIAINDKGPIGLQLHAGHHMKVQFRNIKLTEIQ